MHSSRSERNGAGENLAVGYGSVDAATQAWYDEISLFDQNNGGFGMSTGHYTQVVWAGTERLGCAEASCGSRSVQVCHYGEASLSFSHSLSLSLILDG